MSVDAVLVGVCTYRRPTGLEHLLSRLADLADASGRPLGVVVVDDDPDRSADPVVARWCRRFSGGIDHRRSGSGNISTARNLVLDASAERTGYDWLVLLDDDEDPRDTWLDELFRVQRTSGCDLTVGVVRPRFPVGSPTWLSARPFQTAPEFPDGSDPAIPITGNLLISLAWLRRTGLRFDEDYGTTGGEDVDFFRRARAAGASIRYSATSIVAEIVPPARATLRYQLHREFRIGTQLPRLSDRRGAAGSARMAVSALRRIVAGAITFVVDGARSGRAGAFWGLAQIARGAGTLVGLAGGRVDHR